MIHIGIATFQERKETFEKTIESLKNQADKIHVYLNDYARVPAWLNKIDNVIVYKKPEGDLTDNGKFYGLLDAKGYYITADDDIIYPEDFVSELIKNIDRYQKQAVCTYGGRKINSLPAISYYRDKHEKISLFKVNEKEIILHTGYTGAMGFHTDTINFNPLSWQNFKMADILFAKECYSHNVPIVSVKHDGNFINQISEHSIYDEFKGADNVQTSVFNTIDFSIDTSVLCPELQAFFPKQEYKRGSIYFFKDQRGRKVAYKWDKYTKILVDTKQIYPM